MIQGDDIKVVRTENSSQYALYVNGILLAWDSPDDIIRYILLATNHSFQNVVLANVVNDEFDGVFPQRYREIDEIVDDRQNCEF